MDEEKKMERELKSQERVKSEKIKKENGEFYELKDVDEKGGNDEIMSEEWKDGEKDELVVRRE